MPYNKNQTVMEVMMSVNLMRVNLYLKKMQGNQGDNMTTEQPTTQETTTEEVTEEATTAAKNNTASNVMDADDGYIFPDADTSYTLLT